MSRTQRRNRPTTPTAAALPVQPAVPAWAARLTTDQIRLLTAPIDPVRVLADTHGRPYLQWWDVDRWLTRIFGHGNWSSEVRHLALTDRIQIDPTPGDEDQRTRWVVVYEATVRVTVSALDGTPLTHHDGAAGYATEPVTRDRLGQAMVDARKSAASLGITRAALHIGDQFGLGLRNDGGTDPVVIWTAQAGSLTGLPERGAPSEVVHPDRPGRHRTPDPDVVALLDGLDTMDRTQVAAVARRADRAGLTAAYAGWMPRPDGADQEPVTVSQVLARRLAALDLRPPAQIVTTGTPVGALPAGTGRWPCGCPVADVARAGGRHPDTCRDRQPAGTNGGGGRP